MKNTRLYFLSIVSTLAYNGFPQNVDHSPLKLEVENKPMLLNKADSILSYTVEEKINMKFGGGITTYNVPNMTLVNTNELGPDNERIITPIIGKSKVKVIPKVGKEAIETTPTETITTVSQPNKAYADIRKKKEKYIEVNMFTTYERIIDKGYESVEMLMKVADKRFFDGDYEIAARWYSCLFDLTNDFDAVYYYRYAVCLKYVCDEAKAKEMMKLFKSKSTNK